jgi:hypothetical protein
MLVTDMEDKVVAVAKCRAVVAACRHMLMYSPKAEAMLFHPFHGMLVVPQEGSTGDMQEFLLHTVHPCPCTEGIIPREDTVFLQALPGCLRRKLTSSNHTPTWSNTFPIVMCATCAALTSPMDTPVCRARLIITNPCTTLDSIDIMLNSTSIWGIPVP